MALGNGQSSVNFPIKPFSSSQIENGLEEVEWTSTFGISSSLLTNLEVWAPFADFE
jgi:hypothetical protein